jgi:hypothetical protein
MVLNWQKVTSNSSGSVPFYISAILDDRILIRCLDGHRDHPDASFGAFPSWAESGLWYVPIGPKENLPSMLEKYRDLGLAFLDGTAGWPPAAIFQNFRESGQIKGSFQQITFSGPGTYKIENSP